MTFVADLITSLAVNKSGAYAPTNDLFTAVLGKLAKPQSMDEVKVVEEYKNTQQSTFLNRLKKAGILSLIVGILLLKPVQAFAEKIFKSAWISFLIQVVLVCIATLIIFRN